MGFRQGKSVFGIVLLSTLLSCQIKESPTATAAHLRSRAGAHVATKRLLERGLVHLG